MNETEFFTAEAAAEIDAPAFLKMGVYGNAGTGKSRTSTEIAIGLAKYIKKQGFEQPPVFFLDTEKGSMWLKPFYATAGVKFLPRPSRSFADLKPAILHAERSRAILIIDSMSYYWDHIQKSFLQAKRDRLGRQSARMEVQDWGSLKEVWRRDFVDPFLDSQAHIILCGRSGEMRETQEDEETGKKEMITVGTKMQVEKNLPYEPNLVIEMTQRQGTRGKGAKRQKLIERIALVLKDRADVLDGQSFVDPTFEDFLPHVTFFKIGGKEASLSRAESNGPTIFSNNFEENRSQQRGILVEKIMDLLNHHVSGQTTEAKAMRRDLFVEFLGTTSKREFEELLSLERLKEAYRGLKARLEPTKEAPVDLDDEIPDFANTAATSSPAAASEASASEGKPAGASTPSEETEEDVMARMQGIVDYNMQGVEDFSRGIRKNPYNGKDGRKKALWQEGYEAARKVAEEEAYHDKASA